VPAASAIEPLTVAAAWTPSLLTTVVLSIRRSLPSSEVVEKV
jgi:hypothetical protein